MAFLRYLSNKLYWALTQLSVTKLPRTLCSSICLCISFCSHSLFSYLFWALYFWFWFWKQGLAMLSELVLILLPLSLPCGPSHCHTWVKQQSPGVCPAVCRSAFVSGCRHGALVTLCTSSLFQTRPFVCLCGHSGFDVCWGCSSALAW